LSDFPNFTCNLCGKLCEGAGTTFEREDLSCSHCGSSVRLRGLVALLTKELLGIPLTLPERPPLKGIRGMGMSDPSMLATPFAEKFDYVNTFYHQAPYLDVTAPAETDQGRYDFIVSSEVMEHVPPPIEDAFANLCRMLKPDGLLLLTVPYGHQEKTVEHFPELYEYGLVSLGGRPVLVNRRRDGTTEVFENLCFHGGDGSTVELRIFADHVLKKMLIGAGFSEVHFATENVPEFGVNHTETWGLPIVARKGRYHPPVAELAQAYRTLLRTSARMSEVEQALAERLAWVRQLEGEFEERTQWALALRKELDDAIAAKAIMDARMWTRIGRKLGLL